MGLPYGEEIMIVGRTMWTQCTSMTDRQTDRQTDKQTDRRTDRITIPKTVQRRASHGKNLSTFAKVTIENKSARFLWSTVYVSCVNFVQFFFWNTPWTYLVVAVVFLLSPEHRWRTWRRWRTAWMTVFPSQSVLFQLTVGLLELKWSKLKLYRNWKQKETLEMNQFSKTT